MNTQAELSVLMLYMHDIIGAAHYHYASSLMCIGFLTCFYARCFLHREEERTFFSSFDFCQRSNVPSVAGAACAADAPVCSAAA